MSLPTGLTKPAVITMLALLTARDATIDYIGAAPDRSPGASPEAKAGKGLRAEVSKNWGLKAWAQDASPGSKFSTFCVEQGLNVPKERQKRLGRILKDINNLGFLIKEQEELLQAQEAELTAHVASFEILGKLSVDDMTAMLEQEDTRYVEGAAERLAEGETTQAQNEEDVLFAASNHS